jgi:hypothetical protein
MTKITKLLIAITLLIAATEIYGQEKCNYYCHNGTVVKAINDNASKGHEAHGDIFLGDCDTFTGVVGGACGVLSAEEFDWNAPLPYGKKYYVTNMIGQIIQKGVVSEGFKDSLPKQEVLFIKIKGYKLKKIIKN